jgi:hypothetical protein
VTVTVRVYELLVSKLRVLLESEGPVQHVTALVKLIKPVDGFTKKRPALLPPVIEYVKLAHNEKAVSGSDASTGPLPLHWTIVPGGALLYRVCSCTVQVCAEITGFSFTSVT